MSMKLNLKLLSTRFSQAKEQLYVPDDGVNPYLLEHILRPNLEGEFLRLGDIDFDAFEADDVPALEEYYDRLYKTSQNLAQFAQTVARVPPAPQGGARVLLRCRHGGSEFLLFPYAVPGENGS